MVDEWTTFLIGKKWTGSLHKKCSTVTEQSSLEFIIFKKRDVLPDRRGPGSSVGIPGTPYRQCARSTGTPELASLSSEKRKNILYFRYLQQQAVSADPDLDWEFGSRQTKLYRYPKSRKKFSNFMFVEESGRPFRGVSEDIPVYTGFFSN